MKLSVSLPAEDVAILDGYARNTGLRSRSAALRQAIHMLRLPSLEQDYAAAWEEWEAGGEQAAWQGAVGDGMTDAAQA